MKNSLSLKVLDLIKYTIISLPPGTSVAFIFNNFMTRRQGLSLIPPWYIKGTEDKKAYVQNINNVVVRSIKESLNSFRCNPLGKSLYRPLPQDYSPYSYIIPKPGLEHLRLPPFTYEDWKSQFQPTLTEPRNIMATKKKANAKKRVDEGSILSPTRPSTFVNQAGSNNARPPPSPRIPTWLKPRFGSPIGAPVLGVDVNYHLIMTFNESNIACVGEVFNLWAALVNNGVEKDGVKSDVLLLDHVRGHPLNNVLPFSPDSIPFIGADKRTIFMPISFATEPTVFDSVSSTMRNDQAQRLGPDLQQLSTFCAAFQEQSAQECPVYHIKVAIQFKNSPLFERGTGEYQLRVVIAVNPYGLSTDILSRGYLY